MELALLEDVLDVPRDDRLVTLEKLGHLTERQPRGLAIAWMLRFVLVTVADEDDRLCRCVGHVCSQKLRERADS